MANKTKTIVTIGDGIAAWCLHHKLKQISGVQVINIAANDFFPPCSTNTTSINCLRGTRQGVSKLGDTIRKGMFFFEGFYRSYKPSGVVEGFEHQILEEKTHKKWVRRYPEFYNISENKFLDELIKEKTLFYSCPAYFINPLELKEWLHKEAANIEFKNAFVKKVTRVEDHYEIKLLSETLKADKVILCTNHLTPFLSDDVSEDFQFYLNHTKPVSGSYLELNNASSFGFKFDKTFNLAIEKYHFIYREDEDQIQIGMTSNNRDTTEIPKTEELRDIYNFIDTYTKFKLPSFNTFEKRVGIRFKGYYRLPFWGKIDSHNLYAICGLYKNAFTYGFLAADEVVSTL